MNLASIDTPVVDLTILGDEIRPKSRLIPKTTSSGRERRASAGFDGKKLQISSDTARVEHKTCGSRGRNLTAETFGVVARAAVEEFQDIQSQFLLFLFRFRLESWEKPTEAARLEGARAH